MDKEDIKNYFCSIMEKDEDLSVGIAAIETLMHIVKTSKYETVQGMHEVIKEGISAMKELDYPVTAINSGCELFVRFITLCYLDTKTIDECRNMMLKRASSFSNNLYSMRSRIVTRAQSYILDGTKIFVHSRSRVVLNAMRNAAKENVDFEVFVTQSMPDKSGERMHKELQEAGIKSTLVLDAAIGYVLEHIDIVMLGAEGIMENGGVVNKIGTCTVAMCAKRINKPVYILAETFKFSKQFILNGADLPDDYKFTTNMRHGKVDFKSIHPLVDYTPPDCITLLITDIGILPPNAVSGEVTKLYL